jgi:hypothetical protein
MASLRSYSGVVIYPDIVPAIAHSLPCPSFGNYVGFTQVTSPADGATPV